MRASRHPFACAVFAVLLLLGAGCSGPQGSSPTAADPALETPESATDKSAKAAASGDVEARPEDAFVSSVELVNRAQAAVRDLERIAARATVPAELETLADKLPERRAELGTRVTRAEEGIRRSRRAAWVRDIRFSFVEDGKRIAEWQLKVEAASAALASGRKRTTELLAFWRRADELAKESDAAPEIREQTARVVKEARRTELALTRPEAVIIPLQSTLAEMKELTESVLGDAGREGAALLERGGQRDFSLAQAIRELRALDDPAATVRRTCFYMWRMVTLFVARSSQELAAHGVFLVLVLLGLVSLRSRAQAWTGDEREAELARHVVGHPFAAALLLGMLMSPVFHDAMPTAVLLVVYVVALVSALVLFPRVLDPRIRRIGYTLGAFVLCDAVRLFLIEVAPLERLVLTLELFSASLLLGWLLRRRRWQASPFSEHWTDFYRAVGWAWLVGLGVGTAAALAGYGSVAEILGGGVLISMYLALIVLVGFRALGGALWMLTQSKLLQRLHAVKDERARVLALLSRTLRWGGLVLWVHWSLGYLTLRESAKHMLTSVLGAALEVGALKVSVGDFVVLALGTALAVYAARFIRFLLDVDVLPRLRVGEGMRHVTLSSAYYVVLLVGFFFTLAAAGIRLDRLTVLAGALGVGIGFGLQNLVQNFVAGLILMFGGPVKVRDQIQLGELTGEVRTIGFRSSIVRTQQGAEVIVPNSKLIEDRVINWTLSDQKRRIDIDIGIEYGNDPLRVLALLREVGASHPKVLKAPPPDALFLCHGTASLDFQLLAWVGFEDYTPVRSELTTAINRRFAEEKIGLPSPLPELNLVTITPEAAQALSTVSSKPS
jgi:potassium efflux system protein